MNQLFSSTIKSIKLRTIIANQSPSVKICIRRDPLRAFTYILQLGHLGGHRQTFFFFTRTHKHVLTQHDPSGANNNFIRRRASKMPEIALSRVGKHRRGHYVMIHICTHRRVIRNVQKQQQQQAEED